MRAVMLAIGANGDIDVSMKGNVGTMYMNMYAIEKIIRFRLWSPLAICGNAWKTGNKVGYLVTWLSIAFKHCKPTPLIVVITWVPLTGICLGPV